MSRIGKQIITVPSGVTLEQKDGVLHATGPKGTLTYMLPQDVSVEQSGETVTVNRLNDEASARANHGLVRTLVNNMIIGVSTGFTKQLELQGVGYRAALQGNTLVLSLGFSHPVNVEAPEGITFKVEKNIISVQGIDKALIGEVSARIRAYRKPEPYKGKGIRYVGEFVRRKAGKAAKA